MSEFKRVIIAGSRTFWSVDAYLMLQARMDDLIVQHGLPEVIISGTAKGADLLGEVYADENQIPIQRFPADWEKFGKKAGMLRNIEMASHADTLVAFWDGYSKGTRQMLEHSYKIGLKVYLYRFRAEIQ